MCNMRMTCARTLATWASEAKWLHNHMMSDLCSSHQSVTTQTVQQLYNCGFSISVLAATKSPQLFCFFIFQFLSFFIFFHVFPLSISFPICVLVTLIFLRFFHFEFVWWIFIINISSFFLQFIGSVLHVVFSIFLFSCMF